MNISSPSAAPPCRQPRRRAASRSCAAAQLSAASHPVAGCPLLAAAPALARWQCALSHSTSMGQSASRERERLMQVRLMLLEARCRIAMLQPLAAAEEAAGTPPMPDSSQAAYQAALQWNEMLTNEMCLLHLRIIALSRGNPNPTPMPPQTPPLPRDRLPTPAAAANARQEPGTPASTADRWAASGQQGHDTGSSGDEHGAGGGDGTAEAGASVPLLAGPAEAAMRGLRHRQRQEGVR